MGWLRYYLRLKTGKTTVLHMETEMRRHFFPERQHQWLVPRLHLRKQVSEALSIGVGGVHFLQILPQRADAEITMTRLELRPHQDFILKLPMGKGVNIQRFRIEQRWVRNTEGDQLAEGFNFRLRLRYFWRWQLTLWKRQDKKLNLKLQDEILFHAFGVTGNNIFNQNRISAAFNFQFNPSLSAEATYIHWYQQRRSLTDYYNRHILRITILHRISLLKKQG